MRSFPTSILRRRVLVDSSANLAAYDSRDRNHQAARRMTEWLVNQKYRLYTTNAMLFESHALLLSVLGSRIANRFLQDVMGGSTVVVRVRASDEGRAQEILYTYEDKSFSYNDAISFAVMERLEIDLAFTFDSDLRQYGWTVLAPPLGG